MKFRELKETSSHHFYSLRLDKLLPRGLRAVIRKSAGLIALIFFFLSFPTLFYFEKADSIFFIAGFVYMLFSFLEFFYNSMKAEGLSLRMDEETMDRSRRLDYALSSIIMSTSEVDVVRSLFESKIGLKILSRSGITQEEGKHFVYDSARSLIMASSLNFEDSPNLGSYIGSIYDADKSLATFLSQYSVNREEFIGAAFWVGEMEEQKLRKERFWSRENLGAIPSVGKSWSYGESRELGKYGISFERTVDMSSFHLDSSYRKKEVYLLEEILNRRAEANTIIIDDDENVSRDIVARLLKRIKLGISLPSIEHKVIIELDWSALFAEVNNRDDLEKGLLKIFDESLGAGNIIIYIKDLPGFMSRAKSSGISLASVLSPYLSSSNLQIIASASNADFHFFIETNPGLLQGFERIIPEAAGVKASVSALLEQIPLIEKEYGIFFTFPAVLNLVNSADRFVVYGGMPGKALDLLAEIAPWAANRGQKVVGEKDVNSFVSEKTGIATGAVGKKEAEKIQNLEELLHKRVIAQDEAIKGIANAMRRSRSGVNNPKRPLASFLFIGPTGVGKTESSKALAENFFGSEDKMIRFDMSEYSGPDALPRLIGDFVMNKSGLLASKIRDNPYSVLLLDEFEKAARDVHDLFLQILDEGIFTDALGRQVGCRNLIIIATSNAGSDFIWEALAQGRNLSKEGGGVVDEIIKNKIFRPELLNRFDGVVVFHPLRDEDLRGVAKIGMQKLGKRLKEKDIEIVTDEDVFDYLVEKGASHQFGARSINRAIQNEIENLVAKKIVGGEVAPGGKIEIKRQDLAL